MIANRYNAQKQQGGFTLIEILIYMAVLVLASTAAVGVLFSLDDLIAKYRAEQLVTRGAVASLERMLLEIRAADMLDALDPDLVLVDSPGHLVLIDGATTTEFALSGGRLVVTKNGTEIGPLTATDVTVDELRFFHYDSGVTEAVRIELGLTAVVGGSTSTRTFNGMAVLQGSYD